MKQHRRIGTLEFGFWTCHVLQGLMSSLKVEGIEGSGFGELVSLDVVLVTRSCRSWQLFWGACSGMMMGLQIPA